SVPSQMSRFQASKVRDRTKHNVPLDLTQDNVLIEDTPIFDLLIAILERSEETPIRDTADGAVRKLVRDQARRFIRAFLTAQVDTKLEEVPLQPRISMILPATPTGG